MNNAILEVRATINESGRVVLPKQLREALGIAPGDELIFSSDGETFSIETQKQRALRAQEYISKLIATDGSIVDELIADRRKESLKEAAK